MLDSQGLCAYYPEGKFSRARAPHAVRSQVGGGTGSANRTTPHTGDLGCFASIHSAEPRGTVRARYNGFCQSRDILDENTGAVLGRCNRKAFEEIADYLALATPCPSRPAHSGPYRHRLQRRRQQALPLSELGQRTVSQSRSLLTKCVLKLMKAPISSRTSYSYPRRPSSRCRKSRRSPSAQPLPFLRQRFPLHSCSPASTYPITIAFLPAYRTICGRRFRLTWSNSARRTVPHSRHSFTRYRGNSMLL